MADTHRIGGVFSWTDEAVAALRKLVADGLSASDIGRALGASRLAVIGKARRQGLQLGGGAASAPRPAPKRVSHSPAHPTQVRYGGNGFVYVTPAPANKTVSLSDGGERGLALLISDRGFKGCKWPVDGQGDQTRFCCLPSDGRTYCSVHAVSAYQPSRTQARHSTKELIRSLRRVA